MKISKREARNFLLRYQGLLGKKSYTGHEGVLAYLKQVRCVQFDPLNVVGRNADLVLQSRIEGYSNHMLEYCLYEERTLMDGWDKMMSIYPATDWHSMKAVRERHAKSNEIVMAKRKQLEALNQLEAVRSSIEKEGPKMSRELNLGGGVKGRWSSSKYANVALDHLFHLGVLGIHHKKNSQKCYELMSRLQPTFDLEVDAFETEDDFLKWYILKRINSVGMIWSKNGGAWLGHFLSDKKKREHLLKEMLEDKIISTIELEGVDVPFYISTENVSLLEKPLIDTEKQMRFLAPLDNILWDREMVKVIFDFEYSWEVYVPEVKRKFGYYVLPVLYGDEIIARFEPQHYKSDGVLVIKKWWWEADKTCDDFVYDMALKEFANYLGATTYRIESLIK